MYIYLEAVNHMFLCHCAVVMMVMDITTTLRTMVDKGNQFACILPVISPQRSPVMLTQWSQMVRGRSLYCDFIFKMYLRRSD